MDLYEKFPSRLVKTFSQIHADNYKFSPYSRIIDKKKLANFLFTNLREHFKKQHTGREILVETFSAGPKVIGFFALVPIYDSFRPKVVIKQLILEIDLKSKKKPEAFEWAKKVLLTHRQQFAGECHMILSATYKSLLPTLKRCGLFIDTLQLWGKTSVACEQLSKKNVALPEGWSFKELKSPAQVTQFLKLCQRVFKKYPEHAFFALYPEFLKMQKKNMLNMLKQKRKKRNVMFKFLYHGKKMVGSCSATYQDKMLGVRMGGADYHLDLDYIGKGVGTILYAEVFKFYAANKVVLYRGNSANPAVLNLSKQFKRNTHAIFLRNCGVRVTPKRFEDFLKG